ncbi:hypothetical protein AGMMS49921_02250 [Endomicrobiia bacterium]|nr:hypothetical protein AGMMS49921_02250 [Endomicrobiia bacterium]
MNGTKIPISRYKKFVMQYGQLINSQFSEEILNRIKNNSYKRANTRGNFLSAVEDLWNCSYRQRITGQYTKFKGV